MKQFDVTGMSCAACSARVEKAVSKVSGVTQCSVNLLTNSMSVEGSAKENDIIDAVVKAGYGASLKGQSITAEEKEYCFKDTKIIIEILLKLVDDKEFWNVSSIASYSNTGN